MAHLLSEYADWILIVLIAEALIILIESIVLFRVCEKLKSKRQNQLIQLSSDTEIFPKSEVKSVEALRHPEVKPIKDFPPPDINSEMKEDSASEGSVAEEIIPPHNTFVEIIDDADEEKKIGKTSILLIEDDPAMQQAFLKALENDYTVICHTAPDTIQPNSSGQFDIAIISEPLFPYTVKYKEIIKKIKSTDKSDARKIVVLADNITDTQLSNGYKEGIDLFLKKPITPEDLQRNLKSLYADLSIASLPPYRHLSGKPLSNEDRRFIRRLTSLLEEDTDNDSGGITIVAQRLAMSHSSLYKKLKAITGLSVIEFSNAHKISLALKKMQEGNDRIHEISNECGFRDVKSFRQSFKTLMGMTPSQYIKTLQENAPPPKGEAT